ncbi:Rrf2 family transcriptional regulator [Phyllobacterium sp. TAF24]|uniref:Rrf2 family transcriptional regulator n=1 Tax=unclassified Phyllobacterium TaxID=2638441 RepID=UPI00088FB184|nr:Rrf2 family transcriptional regulator [Phyllobacterium sp. OV277]SDP85206.1 transcriptional regulator, BadM/Rrf2 family [Phyllobacterium sp. OV277]
MRRDSRLSRMLHVLIHMDRHTKRMTSETIAQMLGTNAVVIRRTMAGLKKQGYVRSENGHGGGWELTRGLADISLLDVYVAIGAPPLFAIGPSSDHPTCLVEQAVDAALDDTLRNAELLLRDRLAAITIADLASDFDRRFATLRLPDGICAAKA